MHKEYENVKAPDNRKNKTYKTTGTKNSNSSKKYK